MGVNFAVHLHNDFDVDVGVHDVDVGVHDIDIGAADVDIGADDVDVGVGVDDVDIGADDVDVDFHIFLTSAWAWRGRKTRWGEGRAQLGRYFTCITRSS